MEHGHSFWVSSLVITMSEVEWLPVVEEVKTTVAVLVNSRSNYDVIRVL